MVLKIVFAGGYDNHIKCIIIKYCSVVLLLLLLLHFKSHNNHIKNDAINVPSI